MKAMARTLYAEILKLKRTLALWLALLVPLIIVGANCGIYLQRGTINVPEGTTTWLWYGQMNVVIWGLLMIPLFVTLETALVGNLEHANDQWTHLYTLPVPRGAIYATKQIASVALVTLSSLSLVLTSVGGGVALQLLRPSVGLGWEIPWGRFMAYAGLISLGVWLVSAIQTWISLRWKNFVVTCAVGVAMTVAGVFIIHADWGGFWPWALVGTLANEFSEGVVHVPELLFGSVGGVVVAVLGGWDVTRMDVL